jgi:hypothetical protein
VTGAACSSADPQYATSILIQRHHIVVAQAVGAVRIAAVPNEALRRAIEEVEAI